MKNLQPPIIIEMMDEDGYYIVSCPLFKGCRSYGETIGETLKNIREVIDICLEETRVKELNKFVGSGNCKWSRMPKLPVIKGRERIPIVCK